MLCLSLNKSAAFGSRGVGKITPSRNVLLFRGRKILRTTNGSRFYRLFPRRIRTILETVFMVDFPDGRCVILAYSFYFIAVISYSTYTCVIRLILDFSAVFQYEILFKTVTKRSPRKGDLYTVFPSKRL